MFVTERLVPRTDGACERKPAIDVGFEFLARDGALLHKECSHSGQMALVIGRIDIVSWRHALDGVSEFIHVVDVTLQRECRKGADQRLPSLLVWAPRVCHTSEALLTPEVMHTVRGLISQLPGGAKRQSWNRV